MAKKQLETITPEQLCVGLFVQLDISWMKHDFISNSFKISSVDQLEKVKALGLDRFQFDPQRSDTQPLPLRTETPRPPSEAEMREAQAEAERQARIETIRQRQLSMQRCEKAYSHTVGAVRNLMQNLFSQPAAAVAQAGELVSGMVDKMITDEDVSVQLVNMKSKSESTYYHAVNVTVLSLMLGRELGLDSHAMNCLGIGALLHDLGHNEVPGKILRKKAPLTKPEQDLYERHPLFGVRLAERIGTVPREAMRVIGEHHEMVDGSGYPNGLSGDSISELARIVAIVNAYDNLCNHVDPDRSATPHEAMSRLYAREKHRFDAEKLTVFITHMGVYPPGTIVRLSDGRLAVVVSINRDALLYPNVMVYDPQMPRSEALILSIREEGLSIAECQSRSVLAPEVAEYLSQGESVNYYFDQKPSVS